MIKVLIADNQPLTREGVKILLADIEDIYIIGQADNIDMLEKNILELKPQVVIIDHDYSDNFSIADIKQVHTKFPETGLLILSNTQNRGEIAELAAHGIQNYLFKACSKDDLLNGIYATARGEQFFCADTLKIMGDEPENEQPALSIRETEIVQLVAAGMANKEIAEKLYLSIHTVKTHRKNIIKKLGFTFKNAADLMVYASKIV